MNDAPPIWQNEAELARLLDLYDHRQPKRVLELGVGQGGTLYHWLTRAPDYALVVAVDDQHANRGSYHAWLDRHIELVELTGLTASPDIVKAAAAYAPFDWLFIDADHHDAAVREDWRLYRDLVRPGGVIAFHDITPTGDPTVEVDRLWSELRASEQTAEWQDEGWRYGIGVVFTGSDGSDGSDGNDDTASRSRGSGDTASVLTADGGDG